MSESVKMLYITCFLWIICRSSNKEIDKIRIQKINKVEHTKVIETEITILTIIKMGMVCGYGL